MLPPLFQTLGRAFDMPDRLAQLSQCVHQRLEVLVCSSLARALSKLGMGQYFSGYVT